MAVLDLFEHFGPYSGVTLFVLVQAFGLEVNVLRYALR